MQTTYFSRPKASFFWDLIFKNAILLHFRSRVHVNWGAGIQPNAELEYAVGLVLCVAAACIRTLPGHQFADIDGGPVVLALAGKAFGQAPAPVWIAGLRRQLAPAAPRSETLDHPFEASVGDGTIGGLWQGTW